MFSFLCTVKVAPKVSRPCLCIFRVSPQPANALPGIWGLKLPIIPFPQGDPNISPPLRQAITCSAIPPSQDLTKFPNRSILECPEQVLQPSTPSATTRAPRTRPQDPRHLSVPALPALWHIPPHLTWQNHEATLSRASALSPHRSPIQGVQGFGVILVFMTLH